MSYGDQGNKPGVTARSRPAGATASLPATASSLPLLMAQPPTVMARTADRGRLR